MHAGLSPTPEGPYGFYLKDMGFYDTFHKDYRLRAKSGFALDYRDSVLPAEAFADSYVGRRAATWIDTIPDDYPCFCFVSFVGPHDPMIHQLNMQSGIGMHRCQMPLSPPLKGNQIGFNGVTPK
jgi:hypothetical protein